MNIREPVNSLTHLSGVLIFAIGSAMMYFKAGQAGMTPKTFIAITFFAFGLIALYFTSGYYHMITGSKEKILLWKKLDHVMIFFLIAGTYTPLCLLAIPEQYGIPLLIVVWSIAIVGSLMMIFWIHMPRWLNTALYILLGWAAIFIVYPLYLYLPRSCFFLMLLGGVFYTIGGIIYGIKKPNFKSVGHHEIFHIFVLLGSITQFLAIYLYVI